MDDHVGIPDDLRCKRSDGKQWRCTALSMPDKTVCEKHYFQAKKRAANSALRASIKKTKTKSEGFLERDYPGSGFEPGNKITSVNNTLDLDHEIHIVDSQRPNNVLEKSVDNESGGHSDASTDSSDDTDTPTCHQCRRSVKDSFIWCLKCGRRGYCVTCATTWYPNIPIEEIQRVCPACRGSCNCKICSRGDNLIKARIREIPVLDKLQYLYCLLSSVLPIVKHIHQQQCAEVELEKKLRGVEVDLERMKLNGDEQMCCDCCRVPIVDYHRHCSNCSYDLCLICCQDLRCQSANVIEDRIVGIHTSEGNQCEDTLNEQQALTKNRLSLSVKFPGWSANKDGSVPCLPGEHGGCGCSYLTLQRIFKMNWVAKLVKNLEEMVSGCKFNDSDTSLETESLNSRFLECAYRKGSNDNLLYCPSAEDIKSDGVDFFRKHWVKGEPVLVKQVSDASSSSCWDPLVIWREICETTDERIGDASRMVKTVDCLDSSEVEMELGQFLKGYSEGRIRENGSPQMLKLKDWPSPSASEEFLLYQRPEFIINVPFLEFIHSKWGLLNVAAKLPHYSLQNDVGPKIFISYGCREDLGRGDSISNLHLNMRDMVYLLVHSCDVKLKSGQQTNIEKIQKTYGEPEVQELSGNPCMGLNDQNPLDDHVRRDAHRVKLDINLDEQVEDLESQTIDLECENTERGFISPDTRPGAIWHVFRREDVPKLAEYLRAHWNEFGFTNAAPIVPVTRPLYDETVYLKRHHVEKLKEESGVEPWSFEQYLGQAVFIPAGCPFQVRNFQSTVQLGLDFLSPESLGQAVKLAEEIRCLPNDHVAKLQMVEVGKMSLYAASSAIKEVQKLVLDQKLGAELVFEDHNLTAMVSENLERMTKQRQVACA